MTPILTILAVIALVLYILFGYLVPPLPGDKGYYRNILALIVVIVILLVWRGAL